MECQIKRMQLQKYSFVIITLWLLLLIVTKWSEQTNDQIIVADYEAMYDIDCICHSYWQCVFYSFVLEIWPDKYKTANFFL